MANSQTVKDLYKNMEDWVPDRMAYVAFMEKIAGMMRWMRISLNTLQVLFRVTFAFAEAYCGLLRYLDFVGYFGLRLGFKSAFVAFLVDFFVLAALLLNVRSEFLDDKDNCEDIVKTLVELRSIEGRHVHLNEGIGHFLINLSYSYFNLLCRGLVFYFAYNTAGFFSYPYFAYVFVLLNLYEGYMFAWKVKTVAPEEIWLREKIVQLKRETNTFISAANMHKKCYEDVRNLPDIQSPYNV